MEWYGVERTRVCDCSRFGGDSLKPCGEANHSLQRSQVVRQELCVYSPCGIVPVPSWSHNRVHGQWSGGVSLSREMFQSVQRQYIHKEGLRSLEWAAYFGQPGGKGKWPHLEQSFCSCKVSSHWWRFDTDQIRNCTTSCHRIGLQLCEDASPEPLLRPYPPAWQPLQCKLWAARKRDDGS